MNKSFTKSKELILDEKYKIIPDSDSGVVLVFTEQRLKENKEKVLEPYLFTENLYYPRIAQALRYYSLKTINSSFDISEAIVKSERVFELIDRLDKEFKQF